MRTDENDTDKLKEVNKALNAHLATDKRSISHLQILGYLGEGTYALVNLAYDNSLKRKVALKIFDKKTLIVNRRLANLLVS